MCYSSYSFPMKMLARVGIQMKKGSSSWIDGLESLH